VTQVVVAENLYIVRFGAGQSIQWRYNREVVEDFRLWQEFLTAGKFS
jgi:hypothetical protein